MKQVTYFSPAELLFVESIHSLGLQQISYEHINSVASGSSLSKIREITSKSIICTSKKDATRKNAGKATVQRF